MTYLKSTMAGAFAALMMLLSSAGQSAAGEVNLVLNWVPGGDHAPIYWAREQGLYKDAGIELVIETGTGSGASAKKVGIGRSQVGIADMPTALRAIGQGADIMAVMNIYANSPYGIYWLKSSGIKSFEDLAGRTIGNPPFDAARQMWPALAKVLGIDGDSVKFVNLQPGAKIAALKSGAIDATTNFYNAHFRYEAILGDDMGFVALRDLGFNPYSNSIITNRKWAAANEDELRAFVTITQKAYATCTATPQPCIETLAKAGSQKVEDVTANWELVVELMTQPENSATKTMGFFDPARMSDDYDAVLTSFDDLEPFDIGSAFSNDFLDLTITLPASGL